MKTWVYSIPMTTRFRRITVREGMLIEREGVWSEWSPFTEYDDAEAATWLRCALEIDEPPLRRDEVPLNMIIPVVSPEKAAELVRTSGCRTAKVKVADPGSTLEDDVARVAAVREALGPDGFVRVDANGAWTVPQALAALTELEPSGLQYAEQPCASVEELAELRRALSARDSSVPVAADESIRRADDPLRVKELDAADVMIVKVQPLGGIARLLDIADAVGLPVVVSSALETSVGIHKGLRAAAALPDLQFACGLSTVRLLDGDVVSDRLVGSDGTMTVSAQPVAEPELVAQHCASAERTAWWNARLERCLTLI